MGIKATHEFTAMNSDVVAAIFFSSPHFEKYRKGERYTPPPMPVNPDINPIIAEKGQSNFLLKCDVSFNLKNIGISMKRADSKSPTDRKSKKTFSSNLI
jgi:hypothetical protein